MVYNLTVSPRAQKEIEKAIESYIPNYSDIPNNFVIQLQSVYDTLKTNPFFRIRYKTVRSLKLKKYPYSLYFVVNEKQKNVRILSCFHNKRDPQKRPRI
jgi:plasmid stabilization system protein ParE